MRVLVLALVLALLVGCQSTRVVVSASPACLKSCGVSAVGVGYDGQQLEVLVR
jgi:hypothetical protein